MASCLECEQEFVQTLFGPAELCPKCTAKAGGVAGIEIAKATQSEFDELLIESTPRFFITPILIALNVVFFVAMVASGVSPIAPTIEQLLKWGADFGPVTFNHQWWRLLSSTFVHIGLLHLALNMWCLWSLGQSAERMFGNWTFLALYLLSGLGGSMASLCWNPMIVSAGASGAIFGVAGGLVAFWQFGRLPVHSSLIKRKLASILSFVGYNLLYGLQASGIDHAAHLGGLFVGWLLGAFLHRPLPPTQASSRLRSVLAYVGVTLVLIMGISLAQKTNQPFILDPKTKLMWTRTDNGRDTDWNGAMQYCENLSLAGFRDWRLPTINQLENLYDPSVNARYRIRHPFQLTDCCSWSSTITGSGPAFLFHFVDGSRLRHPLGASGSLRVLCVRVP